MSRKPFKIVPDKEVGKTEILYRGEEHHLKSVKQKFSSIKSSEVYPSFDEDYRFTMFFYNTKDNFLSKLYNHCKENLPRLSGKESALPLYEIIKWSIWVLFGLFVIYTGLAFWDWFRGAREALDRPGTKPQIEREVEPS